MKYRTVFLFAVAALLTLSAGSTLRAQSVNLIVGSNSTVSATNFSSGTNTFSNAVVGLQSGANNNRLNVTNTAFLNVPNNSSSVVIGSNGSGNIMLISNSARVYSGYGYLGYATNSSNNSVVVTGAGARWTNGFHLYVGNGGTSNSLIISNGGKVRNQRSSLGVSNTSSGNSALVTGAGSTWTNSAWLYIGESGSGNSLVISNGGQVAANVNNSFSTSIGFTNNSSNNSALVTGTDSLWTNTGALYVGNLGNDNSMVVSDGGKVISASGFIGGGAAASNNSALVTGANSLWTNSGKVTVGGGGSGNSLTVADGGTVAATTNIVIAASNGSSGTVNIGRFGTNDAGGAINTPTIAFGSGTGVLNFNQSNAVTITSAISGAGSVNQLGSGTTILSASNSYSGTTTVSAGVLSLGNTNALSGSTLNHSGTGAVSFGSLSGAKLGGLQGSGNLALTNDSGAAVALTVGGNNSSTTYSGILSGAGSLAKAGTGTLLLSASNSYAGGTWISGGTLTAGNLYAFGTGAVTVGLDTFLDLANYSIANALANNGGTILNAGTISGGDFTAGTTDLAGTNSTVAEVAGTATVNVSGANTTITNVSGGTVNVNAASTTIASYNGGNVAVGAGLAVAINNGASSGVVSGSGGLTKNSTGVLTLAGTNTFTGATTVAAGKLVVDGSIASSTVNVNNGATLAGSGAVGGIVLNVGGTINPGNSPGTLNVLSNAVWNPGANYNWQISDASGTPGSTNGWDWLNVSGSLDLTALSVGNEFNINLWSLSGIAPDTNGSALFFTNTSNYTWTILTASNGIIGFSADKFLINTTATNGTGGFANVLGGGTFSVSQSGNDLNLVFTAAAIGIPEPGTWIAAALLAGGAVCMRWRKRGKVS